MVQRIGRETVRRLSEQGVVLIDVLPREAYEQEHLAGARNVPLAELVSTLDGWDRDRRIIVYCADGGVRHRSTGRVPARAGRVHPGP